MANYLYNGVELPDINTVWTDKETYPYAYICEYSADIAEEAGFEYQLVVASIAANSSGALSSSDGYDYIAYALVDGAWVVFREETACTSVLQLILEDMCDGVWANTDIILEDGTVYLAASDPVPVGSSDETTSNTTYIGIDGVARNIKTAYIGVNGVARKVKKAYIGIDGKATLCFGGTSQDSGTSVNILDNTWPIEWNSLAVTNNSARVDASEAFGEGTFFVKVSDLTPTLEELTAASITASVEGTTLLLSCVQSMNCDIGHIGAYLDSSQEITQYACSVTTAGTTSSDIGLAFPETGLYVIDYGVDATVGVDFTLDKVEPVYFDSFPMLFSASDIVANPFVNSSVTYTGTSTTPSSMKLTKVSEKTYSEEEMAEVGIILASDEEYLGGKLSMNNVLATDNSTYWYYQGVWWYGVVVATEPTTFDYVISEYVTHTFTISEPGLYVVGVADGSDGITQYAIGAQETEQPVEITTESDGLTYSLYLSGLLTVSGDGAMADYDSYDSPTSSLTIGDIIANVKILDGVTHIGDCAFYTTSSTTGTKIQSVTLPEGLLSIGEKAFYYQNSLSNVVFPNSLTTIGGYAFRNCTSFTEITIPANVTNIGSYAFYGCGRVVTVTVLAETPPTLNSQTNLFSTSGLEAIYVPVGCGDAYKEAWSSWASYIVEME